MPSVVSSVSGLKPNATWNSSQAYMVNIEFESIYVFILGSTDVICSVCKTNWQ